jgi:hypothetical protein
MIPAANNFKARDDEDKGSPSRDGVNPFAGFDTQREAPLLNQRKEKIESSAEALWVRHHPFSSFPPKNKPCSNAARAIARTEMQGMANSRLEIRGFQVSNL